MIAVPKKPKPIVVSKVDLEASLCKDSFYDFFLRFWSTVSGEPLVANWHIRVICDELQTAASRVIGTVDPKTRKRIRQPKEYDLTINVPPGSTKSTICSVMFPVWCWLHDQTIRIICGSYTENLALYLADQSTTIVKSDKFRQLFPEVRMKQVTGHMIRTARGGWRLSTSTGGTITGKHAHIIVIDDPINPEEAISEAGLRIANRWLDQTIPSRVIDKQITPIILVMQRLAQDDPTGHKDAKVGGTPVRKIVLPAVVTEHVRPRSLRKNYIDGLFDPIRLPLSVLKALEEGDMGAYAYAGQYLQSPIPAGGGMFKTDQFGPSRDPTKPVRSIRYWDKAGSAGKGAYTVGVLMGLDRDKVYWVLDVVRGQWEASERERIIKATAVRDGYVPMIGVEQEGGSGGKESAQSTLKNLAGWRVKLDKPVGDKALRADPYAVQVNGGNVRLAKGIWNDAYLAELQFFPFSKFKDQVDASSGAFAILSGRVPFVGGLKFLDPPGR